MDLPSPSPELAITSSPHPEPRSVPFSRHDLLVLGILTLLGAGLRIALAWDQPRLGDEVGTLLNLRLDAGYLLTHFSGWLTMNYFILAEKCIASLFGSEGWPLEILPMLGGIMTIPLTASLARRLGGARLALVAAALVAFNPYLARFSPIIRSYSLMAALAVWAVDLFFRWREKRTWGAGIAAAAVILALLLAHPNGIYVVMGLGVLMGIEIARALVQSDPTGRRAYARTAATFLVPLAGAGVATWLAYRGIVHDVQVFTLEWGAPPPTSLEYVPSVLATYFGSGFPAFVPGVLLLAGVWSATQMRKQLLPLCLIAGLSPVLVSLKGVSHFPWAYARFQIYCIPLLLILMAEGIRWLASHLPDKPARASVTAVCALTMLALATWISPLNELFGLKRENAAYAQTAAYLKAQRKAGDLIVIEGGTQLAMTPFFQPGADSPIRAENFVKNMGADQPENAQVFLVGPAEPLLGAPEARKLFGKLQIVSYRGPAAIVRENFYNDLVRAANRRIDPSLGETYRLLALLDKKGADPSAKTAAREWRLLAQLCKTRTKRFLVLPEQKRDRENDNSNPSGKPETTAVPTPRTSTNEETTEEN